MEAFNVIDLLELITTIERLALQWIQKYISAFGGDPTKVTMCVLRILLRFRLIVYFIVTIAGEKVPELSRLRFKCS
jgi:hypothetical protein